MENAEQRHSFYKFGNNTIYNPEFTWAMSIHSKSEEVNKVCPECGAIHRYPTGAFDVSVEEGSLYPDVLGCGAYPFLIVSQAVIDDWKGAGITSFHTYPVGIANVDSESLRGIPAPLYFRVEIDGHCRIDLEASGLRVIKYCSECHSLNTDPSVPSRFIMAPGTWDKSPLFRDVDLYPRVSFCSDLILELARKHKRTNFRFDPMESPRDGSSKGIDYLGG